MIKIELTDPTEADARAVVAMFREQFPEIAKTWGGTVNVTNTVTAPDPKAISAAITQLSRSLPDAPAPDGYPVKAEAEERERDEDGAVGVKGTNPYDRTGVERDSDGIPWDERIHASTKSTNKDGTWTRRRNTPDATFDAVMAELRGANTARTMEAAAPLTPPEPSAADAFAPTPPPVPTPPAATAPTPPPAPATPPAAGGAPNFVQLMQKITAAQQAGKLDKAKLDEALGQCELEGVAKLVTADDGTRAAFDAVLTAAIA
jgi:hypothetical protein